MTQRRLLGFFALCLLSFVLWWRPLLTTLQLARTNDAYTHIVLIVPLSLAMIYAHRKHADAVAEFGIGGGLLLLGVGGILAAFAWWAPSTPSDVRLTLNMAALVFWWLGALYLCFGRAVFRAHLFPLCFLFWIVPLPDAPLNWIVEFLQDETTVATRWLFQLARVPVTQDGNMLSIPGLDIAVARECSSIRSSLILVVMTMVLAHLFLRSWWRKAILIVLAIPLSVLKNAFRIFVIVQLARHVDRGYLDGRLHHRGGVVFLMIAMGVTVVLLWLLGRNEWNKSAPGAE